MRKFLAYAGLLLLWAIMAWGVWLIAVQISVYHALWAVVFVFVASMLSYMVAAIMTTSPFSAPRSGRTQPKG